MLRMLSFQNKRKQYHFLYVTFNDIFKMLSTLEKRRYYIFVAIVSDINV